MSECVSDAVAVSECVSAAVIGPPPARAPFPSQCEWRPDLTCSASERSARRCEKVRVSE